MKQKEKRYAIIMTSPQEGADDVDAIWHAYQAGDLVELLSPQKLAMGDGVTMDGFECHRVGDKVTFTQGIEEQQLWIL